jgi:quercetin dioxygenase-like cupin family protein
MRVFKAIGMVSVLTLLAPAGTTRAGGSELRIPIGPGSDFTVLSKTTTHDPLSLDTTGPVEIQFSEVNIAPGGTTGALARPGVLVVNVDAGSATLALAGGAGCGSRVVEGGAGAIESGATVSAIRNGGSMPLILHLTSLAPRGAVAVAAAPCPATTEQGVTAKVIHTSTIDTPMSAKASGASDVYVGLVRAEPGRSAGPWHAHSAPVFVAVGQGQATVKLAHGGGHCEVLTVPAGGGTLEQPGMVHEASNQTGQPLAFYVLGFAPSPQPLLTPAPTPGECRSA